MAFKPNYRYERAERDRLKRAKKEEKLKRQQERAAETGDTARAAPGEDAPPDV